MRSRAEKASLVCAYFVPPAPGSENEGWVGREEEDLPRVFTLWNPFPGAASFQICFPSFKSPSPRSMERGGGKRDRVDMQRPRSASVPVVNDFPLAGPSATCTFPDGSLTVSLPCNRSCLFQTMSERKIFTKTTAPHPDCHLWCLALVSSAYLPYTRIKFPCVVPGTSVCG